MNSPQPQLSQQPNQRPVGNESNKVSDKHELDAERDLHIQSCSDHFLAAYRRFEDFGLACDRDEAYQWLHVRDQAARDRLDDEGNNYFQTAGARDARAMRTTEHA